MLREVPPRVHSQATLAAPDIRGRHLAELAQVETLPHVMQIAPVIYRPPGFPLAALPLKGHRLA